jgi:hypothetical protein
MFLTNNSVKLLCVTINRVRIILPEPKINEASNITDLYTITKREVFSRIKLVLNQ